MVLLVILILTTAFCSAGAQAQEPQWLGSVAAPPPGAPVTFRGTLSLPAGPDKTLLRVAAYDQYRLAVNGKDVSIGDTPWDAETYDVTRLMTPGANEVALTAASSTTAPPNCWIWLRRSLPVPGRFDRITFHTRGARANEWLYIEVIDASGNTSGFYCAEKGHGDFILGTSGAEAQHEIDLTTQPTLEYRPAVGDRPKCDFNHIAAIGIRMDQKEALDHPGGEVDFSQIRLQGATDIDITDPAAWRLEVGTGEWRRSTLEGGPGGSLKLRYDFRPAADPKIAVDLRAWRDGKEIGRLVTGPGWRAEGTPVRVVSSPMDIVSWTRVSVSGPQEAITTPRAAGVMLDFGGADRCVVGQGLPAEISVWALHAMPGAHVSVRAENWSGTEVFRADLPVEWTDRAGRARFQTPRLPRGLYRFTTTLAGVPGPERHAALAVLAPGEKRVSSIFDTLTPIGRGSTLHGIDLNWGDNPAMLMGIRDQGVNFIDFHLDPQQLDNGEYAELLAFCRATKLRFSLNNEASNWIAASPDPAGRDRFSAPNGCHRWDIEPAALDAAARTGLFEGVVYDEGEHMQLSRNFYANLPDHEHRKPYIVETTGMTLPQAYAAFEDAAHGVREYNQAHGSRMLVESVFPALWHPLARAGVTLCPKLLKEDIHPVVLAMALGAAKEYGAELWFSPDLWYLDHFPGHSVQEYAAALRMTHAAGVDNVYTEATVALCRLRGVTYELTPYGEALRDFITRYVPAHPRDYTYRDYEPEIAIIRFPDSDWGQADCYYWKTLYGAENLPPTPETGEWLRVWRLLTGGATDPRAVNANSEVYPRDTLRFSYPSPPVAVYDHLVGAELLQTVRTIFLCGITVSDATMQAVRQKVNAGAVCFAPQRLCPADIQQRATTLPARVAEGRGAWIVVGGFEPKDLGEYLSLVPKAAGGMHLRFKGRDVTVEE
jgi:hypothetical protein